VTGNVAGPCFAGPLHQGITISTRSQSLRKDRSQTTDAASIRAISAPALHTTGLNAWLHGPMAWFVGLHGLTSTLEAPSTVLGTANLPHTANRENGVKKTEKIVSVMEGQGVEMRWARDPRHPETEVKERRKHKHSTQHRKHHETKETTSRTKQWKVRIACQTPREGL
jgi:hypothetical protein